MSGFGRYGELSITAMSGHQSMIEQESIKPESIVRDRVKASNTFHSL
jgi:hypothetical protein